MNAHSTAMRQVSFRAMAWLAVVMMIAAALLGPATPRTLANDAPDATNPSETGLVAIFKTLCDSIGQQDTCNGRDTSLDGYMIDFEIFAGTDTTGTPVEIVTVTLSENANGEGNTGNGSQGRALSGELPIGTYTVCEVEFAYNAGGDMVPLDAQPRPEAGNGGSTGGQQTQSGDNCITVTLTAGTAELKFLDEVLAPPPTPTPVPPTPTPVPPTPTPVPPTPTPAGGVGGATGTPRTSLPPTDMESDSAAPGGGTYVMVLVAMAGILASVLLLTPTRSNRRR